MNKQKKQIHLDDSFKESVLLEHYQESGFNQYTGINPIKFGDHTEYTFNALKRNKIDNLKELKNQLGKAYEIFTCCTPATANDDRQGLAVAPVQSGKTASQALATSLAADNGTKVIIHVLGTTSNLKSSNYDDLEQNLGLIDDSGEYDLRYCKYEIGSGKNKYGLEATVDSIAKKIEHQRRRSEWGRIKPQVLYFYLLKQHQQIAKVALLMEDLHKKLPNQSITTLIIDDEVDAYTPNNKGNGVKPSTTYDEMKSLKKACKQHTYLGYTATSQAIWCAHDSSFLRPDFHAVLDAGSGYVGNEALFGTARKVQSKAQRKIKGPHHPVAIDVMSPGITPSGRPKMEMDLRKMKATLESATADFLIAACFLLERRRSYAKQNGTFDEDIKSPPISMMCLPHLHKKFHLETVDWLNSILRKVSSDINNPSSKTKYIKLLEIAHDNHKKFSDQSKPQPTLNRCFDLLKDLFQSRLWEIKEINARNGKIPTVEWNDNKVWFCVGGIGLSRGFVVKGLITTWMPAEAKKIVLDVIEQRGRFFGYKKEYQDLIKIYLQENSMRTFQDYSSFEKTLFNELKETAIAGKSLKYCDPNFEKFDYINNLTASNKDWNDRLQTYTGNWFHTLHSPFETAADGSLVHNKKYDDSVKKLLSNLNLKNAHQSAYDRMRVNPNPKLNKGQKFKLGKFPLDSFYPVLETIEPFLSDRDAGLKSLIKNIKVNYLNKNFDCYITVFNQERRELDQNGSGDNGDYHFPLLGGYSSGRSSNPTLYVGDDRVIFGTNLDPENFDEDDNDSFNIQFHNFSNIFSHKGSSTAGALLLQSVTAMRIKTPWSNRRRVVSNG